MVGNRNCLMSPRLCPFNNILDIGDTIHITHFGMAMQLDSLFHAVI